MLYVYLDCTIKLIGFMTSCIILLASVLVLLWLYNVHIGDQSGCKKIENFLTKLFRKIKTKKRMEITLIYF
jgi:hypothetical protein